MSLCPLTMSPLSLLVVLFFCRHACALSMHQWSVNKLSALIPKLFTAANNRSCRRRFCFVREQVGWIRSVSYRRMLQNYPTHYQSYCQVALYQSTIEEAELIFVYLQRLLCFLLTDGAIVFVVFLGWFCKSKTCILCASLSLLFHVLSDSGSKFIVSTCSLLFLWRIWPVYNLCFPNQDWGHLTKQCLYGWY